MASRLTKIKSDRQEKLEKIKSFGINPYPSKISIKGNRVLVGEARSLLGQEVLVAGRLVSIRGHGGLIFADLKDSSSRIQLMLQKAALKKQFELFNLLDTGDFIAVRGEVVKTKAGEITVLVKEFELLTKTLRTIPSVWYGIKDEEERYRRRYLDLLLSDDLKDVFYKKAAFWNSVREFMLTKGFLEVETPVLEVSAGGADANPFITHHNALDIDLYLRISMGELWQKRLMVAGFDKTFEIGRQFRNEGMSREHLQDYTQMEFYWAYANYEDSMALVEELYKYVAKKTFGKLEFEIMGNKINLGKVWEKIDYRKTILDKLGIDILKASEKELKEKAVKLHLKLDNGSDKGRVIDSLWKSIRKTIIGPAFLIGHPVEVSPLAKRMAGKPELVERYQVIIAGSEMGNGYSELNDPMDQKKRFEKQQELRDKGDLEAQMHDKDFVEALEYGMPPVSGFGVSERLFSFLADKPIRETVLFPLLRPD